MVPVSVFSPAQPSVMPPVCVVTAQVDTLNRDTVPTNITNVEHDTLDIDELDLYLDITTLPPPDDYRVLKLRFSFTSCQPHCHWLVPVIGSYHDPAKLNSLGSNKD